MTTMAVLQKILRAVAGLVYPHACAACRQVQSTGQTAWCGICAAKLLAVTGKPRCPRCAEAAELHLIGPEGCLACRDQSTPLDGIVCIGPYEGILGQLIRSYKYNRRQELDSPLGHLMASALSGAPWRREIDALVPVPASLRERWRYRCWPVGLLAKNVARHLDLDCPPILAVHGKRIRQVDVAFSGRAANVRGAFHLRSGARVTGTRLCLIDDVMTSGATLRETARTLKKAGAASVYAAVLVRAGQGQA
jgi:ComF family protein